MHNKLFTLMRARMCGDASHNLVAVRILHKGVDGITSKFACRTQFKHAPPWESWGGRGWDHLFLVGLPGCQGSLAHVSGCTTFSIGWVDIAQLCAAQSEQRYLRIDN